MNYLDPYINMFNEKVNNPMFVILLLDVRNSLYYLPVISLAVFNSIRDMLDKAVLANPEKQIKTLKPLVKYLNYHSSYSYILIKNENTKKKMQILYL